MTINGDKMTAEEMQRAVKGTRFTDEEARAINARPLPTQNETWGFFGTWNHSTGTGVSADEAWNAATLAVKAEAEGTLEFVRWWRSHGGARTLTEVDVRDFLDSRMGRHYADQVLGNMAEGLELAEAVTAFPS